MTLYNVRNQWGGDDAKWREAGQWQLGNRPKQTVTSIDCESTDGGRLLTGTMSYQGEGPIGFRATRKSNTCEYSVENQWGGSNAPWHPGGTWVIGSRPDQSVVALQAKEDGCELQGSMTYLGEGPIGIRAQKVKMNPYQVPPLTDAEKAYVDTINAYWDRATALSKLKAALQVAVTVELATIPIYLYGYYSINRTPENFPRTEVSRFVDKAGALIMSVAVEEMLHLSLAANTLFSLGGDPQIYLKSPNTYPAVLPGHAKNTPGGSNNDSRNVPIPLAKFSFEQLSHFLAIEYPEEAGAQPEGTDWDTIGQIYSYVRCIISSEWISDDDFGKGKTADHQIHATEYSPSNIDTAYPEAAFNKQSPPPAPQPGSAAKVAAFANHDESHLGASQLVEVTSCEDALEAIAVISFQGEGFCQGAYDDASKDELSHYYKFLLIQSELTGYTEEYVRAGTENLMNNVAPLPAPPPAPAPCTRSQQFSAEDLAPFIYPAPENPLASQLTDGRAELVEIGDALYQYMLIMTETLFRVPTKKQKIYFNRTMHQSMIWILDKFLKTLRTVKTADDKNSLAATFSNINLGHRKDAFGQLWQMVEGFLLDHGDKEWFTATDLNYYLGKIQDLPDVSVYWQDPETATEPSYLKVPSSGEGKGTLLNPPLARTQPLGPGRYEGLPRWPLTPPLDDQLPKGADRHTCMGLNSCKDQGRTTQNDCAGQGYCSTALAYNPADPDAPMASDHTCHVLNACRNQGGCGLYGTQKELSLPGHNECQSQGSCATPINAERFITDGDLRGESVWVQARAVFKQKVWPKLRDENPQLPDAPPPVAGSEAKPDLFQYGPTIGWIEEGNGGSGMTACGSSGLSGAGSCA